MKSIFIKPNDRQPFWWTVGSLPESGDKDWGSQRANDIYLTNPRRGVVCKVGEGQGQVSWVCQAPSVMQCECQGQQKPVK